MANTLALTISEITQTSALLVKCYSAASALAMVRIPKLVAPAEKSALPFALNADAKSICAQPWPSFGTNAIRNQQRC